jgi:hypothetical protein
MAPVSNHHATKVPAVTLGFWIIKILATTLGETGGDTFSMTMDLGYLVSTAIFLSALLLLVAIQIATRKFHPLLYWAVIVASTTAGTTMADFATRSLGIGYVGGSLILFACLVAVLGLWYWSLGSISVATVSRPRVEAFYWAQLPSHKRWERLSEIGSPIRALDMKGERSCSRADWRRWRQLISGPTFRACSSFGPPSFSPGRSEPLSAILSTSPWTMVA